MVGGAAVTEEFHPGFRNSLAAYTVSLLNPKIIRDLDLPRHGLRIVERKLANFLPLDDGRYLKLGAGRTAHEVAKFSARDAERLDAVRGAARCDRRFPARSRARDAAQCHAPAAGWRRCRNCCAARALGKRIAQARHADAARPA